MLIRQYYLLKLTVSKRNRKRFLLKRAGIEVTLSEEGEDLEINRMKQKKGLKQNPLSSGSAIFYFFKAKQNLNE